MLSLAYRTMYTKAISYPKGLSASPMCGKYTPTSYAASKPINCVSSINQGNKQRSRNLRRRCCRIQPVSSFERKRSNQSCPNGYQGGESCVRWPFLLLQLFLHNIELTAFGLSGPTASARGFVWEGGSIYALLTMTTQAQVILFYSGTSRITACSSTSQRYSSAWKLRRTKIALPTSRRAITPVWSCTSLSSQCL